MDEDKREFSFRAPLMWVWGLGLLLIGMLVPGIHCPLGSMYYSSYEIVIPRRLATREGEEETGKISYSIFMRGKNLVIRLKQNTELFAKDFPVYTYSDEKIGLDMPLLPKDCYFDGYVESDLTSLVSLSTCSGLKGIISVEKAVYNIEPMEASSKFEHILYEMKPSTTDVCKGPSKDLLQFRDFVQMGDYDDELEQFGEDTRTKPLNYLWSHTKYVEMFVVIDNNRFKKWGKNVTKTTEMMMEVISTINAFTFEINVKVVLIGMEIWMQKNPINLPVQMRAALPIFNKWRDQKLFRRAIHDVAHLVVGHYPGSIVGDAYFQGACVIGSSAAIASFYHEDVSRFAILMSHELGHNLGMYHDHRGCLCGEFFFCIMHEFITNEKHYSNCSKDNLYDYLRLHKGACLYDKPEAKRIMRLSICGNRVLDRGEECDCGSVETCSKDPCCLPTCKMTKGSVCAFGPCCEGCQFRVKGRVCRPIKDECDLPEYCNGTSMWCQPDVYKQNGTPCRGQGFCYNGRCRGLDLQCAEIFGEGSRSARDSCYRSMNTRGDRFGNCGSDFTGDLHKVFRKCPEKDIKCGKIMCENVHSLPQMRKHHTFIQVLQDDIWCWGADLFEDVGVTDRGEVDTGTVCGPNKICLNKSCSDSSLLRLECNPATQCLGNGQCNNLRHCHCDAGYAPPTCEKRGDGGSIDSGPPPPIYFTPRPTTTRWTTTTIRRTTTTPQTTTPPQTTPTTQTTTTMILPPITIFTSQTEPPTDDTPQIVITPSNKQTRKGHRERILAIFLFLVTLILLVNTVIWYLLILAYAKKKTVTRKKRKKKSSKKRPRKARQRLTK